MRRARLNVGLKYRINENSKTSQFEPSNYVIANIKLRRERWGALTYQVSFKYNRKIINCFFIYSTIFQIILLHFINQKIK